MNHKAINDNVLLLAWTHEKVQSTCEYSSGSGHSEHEYDWCDEEFIQWFRIQFVIISFTLINFDQIYKNKPQICKVRIRNILSITQHPIMTDIKHPSNWVTDKNKYKQVKKEFLPYNFIFY